METVSQRVLSAVADLKSAVEGLLEQAAVRYQPAHRNDPYSNIFVVDWDRWYWEPLDVAGRQRQSLALSLLQPLGASLSVLTSGEASAVQDEIATVLKKVGDVLEQTGESGGPVERAFAEVFTALDTLPNLLAGLHADAAGECIVVPDTNALLYCPRLDAWSFPDVKRFVMVCVPAVLAELDKLKVIGRDTVRPKAESVIRQIKDLRRRGSLAAGVVLRANISRFRTTATEPDFDKALPWLDRTNDDDRIIAHTYEVMRQHSRSPVLLVTRDINLQNKADKAMIPTAEPPEPPTGP